MGCEEGEYEEDDVQRDDLTLDEQASIAGDCPRTAGKAPMGAMCEAEEQRRAWGIQWDTGKPRQEP